MNADMVAASIIATDRSADAAGAAADAYDGAVDAGTARRSGRARGRSQRQARASLPVRVALSVIAAAALIAGVPVAINLRAVGLYNQATAGLESNISAAAGKDPDLAQLSARQVQVDAQFDEAARFGNLLLPSVRDSIATNSTVSDRLTASLNDRLRDQQEGTTNRDNANQSDDAAQSQGGLSDQQKRQVEELLNANRQSDNASNSDAATDDASTDDAANANGGSDSTTTNNSGNSNKPW